MDAAHEWTDERIEELERRFADVYRQASEEMRSKLETHMALFESENKRWQERVRSGEATKAEHDRWLYQWTTDRDFIDGLGRRLAADAVNADRIAAGYINDQIPAVYAENANAAAWQIEKGLGWDTHSFDLYDESTVRILIAEDRELVRFVTPDGEADLRWNRQKFNAAITQSVLQGESIPHAAERLQKVLGMDEATAVRSARTAMTSAENAGRVDSYRRAEAAGIELKQQWMATPDARTRPSHRALDMEIVKVGEDFHAAGGNLRYPGDPKGPASEVYNCRCTLVAWFPGIEQEDPARWTRLPDGMTYEEWKNGKQKAHDENTHGQHRVTEAANG